MNYYTGSCNNAFMVPRHRNAHAIGSCRLKI